SIYTVVELDKSFSDVTGTWSEKYVESMANKLIVEGYETGLFQPNKAITRAEFAALVVRALGLSNKTATSNFSDVAAGAWYANAVAVAAEAGIIKGYAEDNTFRPNAEISRKELAAMVVRASEYAGTKLAADTSALAAFKDAGKLGWAEAEVSAAVKAGIVNGLNASVLAPNGTATRAEAATMLQRFLANAKFINE
uniref:S-layer homology domain-containing protein n=1 Tax=Paenibacillus alkalitolerans TaxID=2799335 RepID=UPI0018F530A2